MFLVFDPIDEAYFVVNKYIPYHWKIIKEVDTRVQLEIQSLLDRGITTFIIRNKGIVHRVKIRLDKPQKAPLMHSVPAVPIREIPEESVEQQGQVEQL